MAPIKVNLKLFMCLLVSWIFSDARAQVSPTHAGSKPHDPSSPSYRLPSKPAPPFLQRCNPLVSRSLTVLCETTNDSLHSTQQTKQLNPIHDDTIGCIEAFNISCNFCPECSNCDNNSRVS